MPSLLEQIIGAAESAVGATQYTWGGNSLATGVDCSGLVQQAFLAAGIVLPRVSASQMRVGAEVGSLEEAQPGDIIGYQNGDRNGEGVEHVAIYIGNGLQIEAYRTGEPVRVSQVRPGATFRRVIGNIDPTRAPVAVPLGSNEDRRFTAAALGVPAGVGGPAADQPGVVAAATVTAPPTGGLGDDLPPDATEEETLAYIREHLPQYAPLLANDEIRYVLTWAVREDKGVAEIQGALAGTEYWRTHAAPSRDVDLFLGSESPAEIKRVTDIAKSIISDQFKRNGLDFDDATVSKLAMQALRAGDISLQGYVVNQAGINNLLAFGLNANQTGNLPAGETAANADRLLSIARAWMVPLDRKTAEEWAVRILNGDATEETFSSYVTTLARGQWAGDEGMLDAIDAGVTPVQYFAPHREIIASTLELNPADVDFNDPRYRDVFQIVDPTTGKRRTMTLGEVTQWARARPEFAKTTEYRQTDASFQRGLIDFVEGRAA